MREIVGIFTHKEAWERRHGPAGEREADEEIRARVISVANRAKDTQRELTRMANELVLDQLFAADLARPAPARPIRTGTVMGLTNAKVHVSLDDPRIDVKLYCRDLEAHVHGALTLGPGDVELVRASDSVRFLRLGDAVRLRVHARDARRGRWVLLPVPEQ